MKKNIALVYGGDSSEFEVSVKSATHVVQHIDPERYNCFNVLVRGSDWRVFMPSQGIVVPGVVEGDSGDAGERIKGEVNSGEAAGFVFDSGESSGASGSAGSTGGSVSEGSVGVSVDVVAGECGDIIGEGYRVDKSDFSFVIPNEEKMGGERVKFDKVLIMIHGTPGENGLLQAYLELAGVPFVSSPASVSLLTFNKYACKCYMRDTGVKVPADVFLKKGDSFDCAAIVAKLGLPLFVKPNSGGSSFGSTKVLKVEDLGHAIEKAFGEDDYVLVEEYIAGRELTNGVYYCEGNGSVESDRINSQNEYDLDNVSGSGKVSVETSVDDLRISSEDLPDNEKIAVLPVTEIIPEGEYFDFAAKYEGASQEICPARISAELAERVRELSCEIFRHLDCRGFARVDYIVRGDDIYFLEINTVPGMTEMSLVPQQIRAAGMTIKEFFNDLLG